MKSPQVENADYIDSRDKKRYSNLHVLELKAGYYVGTVYKDSEGYRAPGSRDSDYFPSREKAEQTLRAIIAGKIVPRMTP